ncbi:FkbM family methyltransferase [Campylobacter insulaenigrae]|uniref:FkbM family methyltransferase n=1 Tax=Campylobacter insulaenigrae TaxID=260714 RepID=UPI0021537D7F|nr:FkbM family methyltransferase [Campylobacter insulaenigrae]MCR6585070.1 FkbM family methyltransferase [Campylobacter insulaenigrae]
MEVMLCSPPPQVFSFAIENKENDTVSMNTRIPIAVSLGVSNYSPWDLEMANMGYKVLQYDGSIDKGPYNHSNILFFKKYVGIVSKGDVISINDILSEFDFCESCHNILQIDIENAEWDIFDKIDIGLLSKYFAQIIFEFHKCYPDNYELSQKKMNILSKINKYYQSIHAHHPNGGLNYYCRGIFFSDLIEVSYLRKDLLPNFTDFRSCGNLKNLDFPNNPTRPDLPIRF